MKFFRPMWAVVLAVALVGLASCKKEPAVVPSIRVNQTEFSIEADGGEAQVVYSVENPVDGVSVEVQNEADWLAVDTDKPRVITLTAQKNDSGDKRTAEIQITYAGAEPVSVEVVQEAFVAPIKLTILNTEDVKVTFSVETVDPEMTWTGQIVAKEWFDEMGSEDEIFEADYEYYLVEAKYNDVTIEEYLSQILNKGSFSSITFGGLDPLSDYVVYIYGMSISGERTTAIYSEEITTLEPYDGPISFTINSSVENHIVYAQFLPSHEGVPFWADIMTKADLDAAELNSTDEEGRIKEYAQSLIDEQIERYMSYDYITSRKEYVEQMSYNYSVEDFNFEGYPNTEYILYACKMDDDANLTGELAYQHVVTEAVEPSDNQITVKITDITQTTVDMELYTTNEDPYIVVALEDTWIENCTTDQEIYDVLVNEWAGSVWNLEYYICYGSLYGTMAYLTPDTDHTLIAFGYTANTLTTPMQKFQFRTLPAGDPDECEFSFEIYDIKAREATVRIRPSDTSVKYYWDIFETDATTEDVIAKIDQIKGGLYDGYQEFQSYMTYLEDHVIVSSLFPEYSYKLGAIPVSCEPDESGMWHVDILGDAVFSEVFTTKESKVADITITAGFEKYYDGDVLGEASPDRYGAWIGYAYVPMKATIEGNYESYRYSMFEYEEGLEDPEVFSDAVIVQSLERVGVNYDAVFRGFWDRPQMIAAVAVDFDGNYSPIYRKVVEFSIDGVSPAEDIIGSATKSGRTGAQIMATQPDAVKKPVKDDAVKVFAQPQSMAKAVKPEDLKIDRPLKKDEVKRYRMTVNQ